MNERCHNRTPVWLRSVPLVAGWFDHGPAEARDGIDWLRVTPFIGMHLMVFGVFWVGWSPVAVGVATALYLLRMFAITAFYHRYFSHRAFKTSRPLQFLFAVLGASAVQRGPLWWAAHHRHHHAHSDQPGDVHSPRHRGFWWSHSGWFLSRQHFRADSARVRDLARFPELRWLDRLDVLAPVSLAVGVFFLGRHLAVTRPELGTSGMQMLVWGFFVSTVVLYHATYTINSLCHVIGSRRYPTRDASRNNFWLALLTFGEGWHNNHHYYPASARQGFFWWEIDLSYYLLKAMSWVGLVWDLKPVPERIRRPSGLRGSPGLPGKADSPEQTERVEPLRRP
jgi:stearoyl-CoA desaturase (delta-9 desaturase)